MKSIITIIAAALFALSPVTFVQAQGTKAAAGEKSAGPAGAGKRTDVYHVHFTKAALGKALQLGDWLKTPDPHNPMPDHFIVLRHQDGDAWDYVVITHLGPKATVEAAGTAVPAALTVPFGPTRDTRSEGTTCEVRGHSGSRY